MQLGQILLSKKWISPDQLEKTIDLQVVERRKLGELLMKQGYIAHEQLENALIEQYWRMKGFWVID